MRRSLYLVIASLAALWPAWALAQDNPPVNTDIAPNTNVAMWAAIVGFIMPAAIAAINRRTWSSAAKAICAFVASLIAAGVTAYLTGDINDTSDVVTAALFVFTAAIASYSLWWKPSGISGSIEAKTG